MISHPAREDCIADPPLRTAVNIQVLIVDDEIVEHDPLIRCLKLDGFDVRCARTGAEGLASAAEHHPSAIIVDLHLPDISGITVMSELRRAGVRAAVLAVTGYYLHSGHEEAAMALGAAAFLRKPLFADELAAALRAAVAAYACESGARSDVLADPKPHPPVRRRFPSSAVDTELASLHIRVLTGDTDALEQICIVLLQGLHRALAARFRHVSRDVIHDAVVDALLDYRANPARYDATRGPSLLRWLVLPAERNLLNRFRSERAHLIREITSAEQLLRAPAGGPDVALHKLDLQKKLRSILVCFTAAERAMLRLWIIGAALRHSRLPLVSPARRSANSACE